MKMKINAAGFGIRATVAACLAASAGAASAVDYSGYFRGGPAATTVHGESRQCYGLGGPGLKYRLGNECDFYGEFQFAQAAKVDGADFNAVVMTNYYSPQSESNDNFGVEQAYVEMKGVDFAPQTLFWMGKRRDRDDVHIVDTFFTNLSGVGAGFTNVDTGFGKFGLSAYKTDSLNDHTTTIPNGTNGGGRLHADFYDIPVNPDGKLRALLSYSHGDSQGGVKGTSGYGITIEHMQDKFFGGGNHIWAQYSEGSMGINMRFDPSIAGGAGTLTASSKAKSYRFVESPSWQIGAFGGQAIAMYEHDIADSATSTSGTTTVNAFSLGARGSYAITSNLKFLTDIGYSSRHPDGTPTQHLTKITIGPALSTGPDFWKRPELRLYVTHAMYNLAAANDAVNTLQAGTKQGTSYGAQVEIWF